VGGSEHAGKEGGWLDVGGVGREDSSSRNSRTGSAAVKVTVRRALAAKDSPGVCQRAAIIQNMISAQESICMCLSKWCCDFVLGQDSRRVHCTACRGQAPESQATQEKRVDQLHETS
jgi:hypothetical protein